MTHVALLRGINMGGRACLPMRDLIAIFEANGATNVRTYIQSGNVVFTSPAPEPLVVAVTAQIASQFGYPGRIVLRSAEELRQAYAANPFAQPGVPKDLLHVYFLADRPTQAAIASLDAAHSPGDSFAVIRREVYLQLPNGMARTRLTNAYFDSRLKTVSTARNWKSVRALLAIADPA
jgi:uncharacterized protein (DUF1697 family)